MRTCTCKCGLVVGMGAKLHNEPRWPWVCTLRLLHTYALLLWKLAFQPPLHMYVHVHVSTDFFSRKILYNMKVHCVCTVVCTMYTCTTCMWDYVVWMRGYVWSNGSFCWQKYAHGTNVPVMPQKCLKVKYQRGFTSYKVLHTSRGPQSHSCVCACVMWWLQGIHIMCTSAYFECLGYHYNQLCTLLDVVPTH